jgi:DNA-binding transcriptional LysR family regulator
VASALAFIAAGFGVALVSQPIKDFPTKAVVFRDLWSPQPVRIPIWAAWKRNGLSSGVVSKFVAILTEVCAAAA